MRLVVGLGNPGPEYEDTRHNVGVRALEHFARAQHIALDERRFRSRFGRGRLRSAPGVPDPELALLAPQTFMNRSGDAVAEAVAELALEDPSRELWLVYDDVDLPFGRLRLRPGGSAGGHRGLADVIACLGRDDLPRLRIGVGRPSADRETAEHVLAGFDEAEQRALPALLERARLALETALGGEFERAMAEFNREPAADDAGDSGKEVG